MKGNQQKRKKRMSWDEDRRIVSFRMYVTLAEAEEVRNSACDAGMSMSEWLREAAKQNLANELSEASMSLIFL